MRLASRVTREARARYRAYSRNGDEKNTSTHLRNRPIGSRGIVMLALPHGAVAEEYLFYNRHSKSVRLFASVVYKITFLYLKLRNFKRPIQD